MHKIRSTASMHVNYLGKREKEQNTRKNQQRVKTKPTNKCSGNNNLDLQVFWKRASYFFHFQQLTKWLPRTI